MSSSPRVDGEPGGVSAMLLRMITPPGPEQCTEGRREEKRREEGSKSREERGLKREDGGWWRLAQSLHPGSRWEFLRRVGQRSAIENGYSTRARTACEINKYDEGKRGGAGRAGDEIGSREEQLFNRLTGVKRWSTLSCLPACHLCRAGNGTQQR